MPDVKVYNRNLHLWTFVGLIGFIISLSVVIINAESGEDISSIFNNHVLKITTIVEYPYLTLKANGVNLSGNDRFEGYCKEVLDLIADKLGFQYELHLVKDSRFGDMDVHGQWNGMIGELLRDEADMAVSSMILTRARAQVVDFSVSFADFRLAVLVNNSVTTTHGNKTIMSTFSFLQPLIPSLWILLCTTTIAAVGCYYLVNWIVSQPKRVTDTLTRIMAVIRRRELSTPAEAQAQEVPVTFSGGKSKAGFIIKITTIAFLIIMLSAYVARYSTLHYFNFKELYLKGEKTISKEGGVLGMKSLEGLWYRNNVKIVVANPGSTMTFLQKSSNPIHRGIHAQIIAHGNHVRSTMEGVHILQSGNEYAFTMEELGAKYIATKVCDLRALPSVYGPKKSFAIAFPQNSKYINVVNQAILHFKETGILQELEDKDRDECDGNGKQYKKTSENKKKSQRRRRISLNMGNIGGIFCFLIVAYFLSIMLGFGEFFVKRRNLKTKEGAKTSGTAEHGSGDTGSAPLAVIEEIESSL